MRKLSLITGIFALLIQVNAQQNPHGDNLKFDCSYCHTTSGWTFSSKTTRFNHDSTSFILNGQHKFVNCRSCHTSLIFSKAKTNCIDYHTDMHNATVGLDCARCHNSKS